MVNKSNNKKYIVIINKKLKDIVYMYNNRK
jgi:hypothetical protein